MILLLILSNDKNDIHKQTEEAYLYNRDVESLYNKSIKRINTFLIEEPDKEPDDIENALRKSIEDTFLENDYTFREKSLAINKEKAKKLCIDSTITINIIVTKDEFISLNSIEKGNKVILVPVLIHQDTIIHTDYNELIIYNAESLKIDNVSTKFSYVKGDMFIADDNIGKVVLKGSIKKSIDYYDEPEINQISKKKFALIAKNINVVSNVTLNNLNKNEHPNNNFKITISKLNISDEVKIKN